MLTRLLIKEGAEVQVVMTPSAKDFITPLTLSTLSKRAVSWDVSQAESWNNHVELGLWADAMLIAPATANTLAKMANGLCDNLLLATYLSARCPVFFAPAMDLDMWEHPSTKRNIQELQSFQNRMIPVEHGELASGLVGKGRMAEPENIVQFLKDNIVPPVQDFKGKKVLITSGPTFEPIDPVRFIGNRSSGKMGSALAKEFENRGAEVLLISGPAQFIAEGKHIKNINVTSAEEMYQASVSHFPKMDIAVMAAAVADFTPATVFNKKVKKTGSGLVLELKKTKDIALELGKLKQKHQLTVGFALETNDEEVNAQKKLTKKNFDFIVLNSLQDKGAGFKHNTNKITIFDRYNNHRKFELKTKAEVAKDIADYLKNLSN